MAWYYPLISLAASYLASELTDGQAPNVYADSDGNLTLYSNDFSITRDQDGKITSTYGGNTHRGSSRRHRRSDRHYLSPTEYYREYIRQYQRGLHVPEYERIPDLDRNYNDLFANNIVFAESGGIQGNTSVDAMQFQSELAA